MSARWKVWSWFTIGSQENPMLKRLRLIQTPKFGVYIHFIYREDLDRDPHDHPWNFLRIVLRGGYTERFYESPIHILIDDHGQFDVERRPLRPHYFRTNSAHKIIKVKPGTITLAIVGAKTRTWGFWVKAFGPSLKFVPWPKYVTSAYSVWSDSPPVE